MQTHDISKKQLQSPASHLKAQSHCYSTSSGLHSILEVAFTQQEQGMSFQIALWLALEDTTAGLLGWLGEAGKKYTV